MADEAKLCSLICSILKHWLCNMCLVVIVEKTWAQSVDQCWLQELQSLVHQSLLCIFLRCNGFAGIQKAVVDQTGNRPPNSDHDLFLCKFGFGRYFGTSFQSNH